jgi:dipeptidyl aminopeptidase/acylaminoacyl peptidase
MQKMTNKLIALLAFVALTLWSNAQEKKVLDHTAYNDWKSLKSQQISKDGNYVSYEITPLKGDGWLYIQNTKTMQVDSFPRGTGAKFSPAGEFLVFKMKPTADTLRQCGLKKVDKKKWPKDSLVIYRLTDKDLKTVRNIKSYQVGNEGAWMAYMIDSNHIDKNEMSSIKKKKKWQFWKKKQKEVEEDKITSKGHILYLYQPSTESKKEFKSVESYSFSPLDSFLLFTENKKVNKDEKELLHFYHFGTDKKETLDTNSTKISQIKVSHQDQYLAYVQSSDTSKTKNYRLKLYDLRDHQSYATLDSNFNGIGSGRMISPDERLVFTDQDDLLFFGVIDSKEEPAEDSLTKSEKAVLDVWHYQDKRLQPQQLLEMKRDLRDNQLYTVSMQTFAPVALEKGEILARSKEHLKGDYILGYDISPYQNTYNWAVPRMTDYYRINVRTGENELIRKEVGMGGDFAPSGRYYTYFSEDQGQHYLVDIDRSGGTCITCSEAKVVWTSDVNGMPFAPYPVGVVGFDEKEEKVYIQSRNDVWAFDIETRQLESITKEQGVKTKKKFQARFWERDSVYVNPENVYFEVFDETTKDEGIYKWISQNGQHYTRPLYSSNHAISSIQRSEDGQEVIFRKSNVQDYPDLYLTDKNFRREQRLSVANPQQVDYNWANVELIQYTSYDSMELEALVYKPENYDPKKAYPMMVYFYELYSDRLHGHYTPRPTASIIYPTEYASAGYVVVIPDIRYKEGHPAQSAYDCIMAVTDEVLKRNPNIDSTRMGLQGQSWGGYQTAQLVTMTTRYKAAMAGAPVANMFSAYGGIRWGSGMNRQFQYERTQSRIGYTIWEKPELYIENSPLFHLPKVETPLLIMHNDKDGAVPWYQGIELFTGMKRLGKPCWLLNYNGDDHNLRIPANKMDLSIRMRQFFDYYLMDAPAPKWLLEGVPAIEKGEEYGLEYMGEEEEN